MKTFFFKFSVRLAFLQLGWLLCQPGWASAGFTVMPALVSNNYSGAITLQVTGLASGGSVVVQKYIDLNNNGVIDAGDFVVQQFNLTDGQPGMVIGGVTNFNVPGDTDAVAGQITAKMILQLDFSQLIVGNYLFKVSNPTGLFPPITNSFEVTNSSYAQKFTGSVESGGAPVPYAAILLFPFTGSGDMANPVGGGVANNAGVYTIPAPVGAYSLLAVKSNYVASLAAASDLVLNAGATVTTNVVLTPATQTISGQFHDAVNSSLGLPGLLVAAQNKSQGLIAISYSGSNGDFSVGVTANQWKVGNDSAGLAFLGYVGGQNNPGFSITNGSVSGVNVALTKATALVYGTVKDTLGNPLPGVVAVYAEDQNYTNYNGEFQSDGYTDANGNYVTGVVGGLGTNDPWQVSIDNSSSFPDYNFSQPLFNQNGGTNISVGEAVLANITALPTTNQITGNVKFEGTNLVGLSVNAYTQDTNNFQAQAITDSDGNYALVVGDGTWNVNVNCQGNNNSLQSILGDANYQCPCGGPVVTILNDNASGVNITITSGGTGEIFGYLTNSSGAGISDVTINLQNQCEGQRYSAMTGANGYYSISVPYGSYNINVDCGGLNSLGYQCVDNASVTLSSASVEQDFTAQSNGGGGSPELYGSVTDANGQQVVGLSVAASSTNGQSYTTTTDANGNFGFNVGNGIWDVSLNCGDLNAQGYACVSDIIVSVSPGDIGVNFSVPFGGASTPVQIITSTLRDGLVGPYFGELMAFGGQTPYAWSLDPSSLPLPTGLTLSTYGVIYGTLVTADLGTNYFIVDMTDHHGNTAQQLLSLAVFPALQLSSNALPGGSVDVPYTAQVTLSGGDPTGNSGWGYNTQGTLPPGLGISLGPENTNGAARFTISGTPTASGTYDFTLVATDTEQNSVQQSYSITISASTVLQITTPAALTNATAGVLYSNQLQATGGTPPYSWTIANGSQQPPGALTLSSVGLLSGVPSASGEHSFTVKLTDHASLTANRTFTLVVNPKPSLSSAAKSSAQFQFLLNGASNQNYTVLVATNLNTTNWKSLLITNSTTTNAFLVTDPSATNQERFYRVKLGP